MGLWDFRCLGFGVSGLGFLGFWDLVVGLAGGL